MRPIDRILALAAEAREVAVFELQKRQAWINHCRKNGKPDDEAVEAYNRMATVCNAFEEIGNLADRLPRESKGKMLADALRRLWYQKFGVPTFAPEPLSQYAGPDQAILIVACTDWMNWGTDERRYRMVADWQVLAAVDQKGYVERDFFRLNRWHVALQTQPSELPQMRYAHLEIKKIEAEGFGPQLWLKSTVDQHLEILKFLHSRTT